MKRPHARVRWVAALCAALALTLAGSALADNPEHVAQFKSTHNCPGCDLSGAKLGGTQAPNANLQAANLKDATFYGGNLRGANLAGANLDGTNFEMTDLTGATGAVLGGAKTDSRTTCPDGTAGPCS